MNARNKSIVHGVDFSTDKDSSLGYETDNAFTKILGFLVASVLNIIPPRIGSFLIHATTKKGEEVKSKATTYHALDTLYTTHRLSRKKGLLKGIIEYFWFKLGNPRAVRNRLRLVKKILRENINEQIMCSGEKPIYIFSLGCGSGRAVLETLSTLKSEGINFDNLNIRFLDKDPEALLICKGISNECELGSCDISFIEDKVRHFDKYLADEHSLKIIEMVGVMDYLGDVKAVEILRKIYERLDRGGILITANIRNNHETKFVTKTVKWHMIYREPADFMKILTESGFSRDKVKIICEPLKIHMVAVCKK